MQSAPSKIDQFFIQVNGTDLAVEHMNNLEDVVVEDDLAQPAMFVLRFYDPVFQLIDGTVFKIGSEITLGAENAQRQRKTIITGEVTALEPTFEQHTTSFVVRGYDKAHRLYRGCKTRTFLKQSDSDIASKIASENGLQADVEASGGQHDYVMQEGQTDMAFLRARAARIGYIAAVRGPKLVFRKAESSPPAAPDQEYGVSLLSFRARLTAVAQPNSVEVRGWDQKAKQAVVGTASTATATSSIGYGKNGAQTAKESFGSSAKIIVSDQPVWNQSEATKLAQAILDDVANDYLSAEGECFGEPALKAGTKVNVKAVGQRFSGDYFVTATRHSYTAREGYRTTFFVNGRNPYSMVATVQSEQPRHTINGVVTGLITNVNDPDKLGRVKLKFPWLNDQEESNWARLAQPGAGKQRGWFIAPEVNDEVLVAFEQGDINRPYVIGGLWNTQDTPPAEAVNSSGKVTLRAIKTRAGHMLEFGEDEGANKGFVRIKTSGGNMVEVSDTDKGITVKSQNHTIKLDDQGQAVKITSGGSLELSASGQTLKLAQSGIELSGSGGKLTIGAAGAELSANANLTLKANAMAELSCNAIMNIKTSAIMNIQGTLVKIN